MIDIKSLRIGNYLNFEKRLLKVVMIFEDSIEANIEGLFFNIPIEKIEPIPLTEQILLDLGFEKQELYLNLSCGSFDLSIDEGNLLSIDSYSGDCIVIGVFNFLHQIQNIVYDLSGKELEFKK